MFKPIWIGRLAGRLAGWLAGWEAGWLVGCLVDAYYWLSSMSCMIEMFQKAVVTGTNKCNEMLSHYTVMLPNSSSFILRNIDSTHSILSCKFIVVLLVVHSSRAG